MFQGDAVPVSPHPDTPLSKRPSIGAPGEPHGISDIPSNGAPISLGNDLSEAFYSSWLPSPDAAMHALKDPQAHDTALSGRSVGHSPSDVEDLWLQETIHLV